jgi:SAM-dependent methyltransferase
VTEPASIRAHAAVPFMNPMSEADVDAAIAALPLPATGAPRVVETGCGAAELLLRILAAHPGATGVGVDPDPHALARAQAAAEARGRAVELVEARAQDAALEPGSFDLVVNVASAHAHGGFPAALGELAATAAAGLTPVDVRTATTVDWAAYEEGLAAEAERYADDDAVAYAQRIRTRRALPDGTTTMGFALVTLRRE